MKRNIGIMLLFVIAWIVYIAHFKFDAFNLSEPEFETRREAMYQEEGINLVSSGAITLPGMTCDLVTIDIPTLTGVSTATGMVCE